MIPHRQPADPTIHRAARRLAYRCGAIVEDLLRDDEIPAAADEFYRAAREDMEKLKETLHRRR